MSRRGEGHFSASGGLRLYWQSRRPEAPPRAAFVLVHGVGEHGGRYENLMEPLARAGYAVYTYDQRGHGRSPGPRVHIDRWSQYRDDLGAFLTFVAQQAPRLPLVLYGHSMGSLVVLDYAIVHPRGLAALIVSGVALQPAGVGAAWQVAAARLLTHVTPRLSLDLHIRPDALTRDPAARAAALADPALTSKATVRWGTESLATVAVVRRRLGEITLPLLVVHGGDDPLNRPAGAQELVDSVSSADKTLTVYPGVRHEPHNDLGHEQVAADIIAWLDRITARDAAEAAVATAATQDAVATAGAATADPTVPAAAAAGGGDGET